MNRDQSIPSIPSGNRYAPFLIIAFSILLIYANTFHAAWHFDDKANILNNTFLHLEDLKPGSLVRTLYTHPQHPGQLKEKMNRPIAFLTLALNWYFGQDHVLGYHVVNLAIHILTAFVLYITSLTLLKLPRFKGRYAGRARFIAFLGALLWAIHPIQTQAVTYIVQRMACLAAFFYILSLYGYLKARTTQSPMGRVYFGIGCLVSFGLAMGSKENAATLPLSLMLLEMIFFREAGSWTFRRAFLVISGGCIFILMVTVLYKLSGNDPFFSQAYENRAFTLPERLMTEARVVVFYLGQIFYPVAGRFSIEHDVVVSTTLLSPWTTLPSIVTVMIAIGAGFWMMQKYPWPAFAILFFFLNHLIESSIIPLELVFEHRNYLPSLFLFVPVAIAVRRLLDHYRAVNPLMHVVIVVSATLLVMGVGFSTYVRNLAWATEISLWEDAMRKAPNRARPLTVLAFELSQTNDASGRNDDRALALYEKSLTMDKARKNIHPAILDNMAGIYLRKGEVQKAADLLVEALSIDPEHHKARLGLTQLQIMLGQWEAAAKNAHRLVSIATPHGPYFNVKGFILFKQGKYDAARYYMEEALKLEPGSPVTLLNMGVLLGRCGEYAKAERLLQRAYRLHVEKFAPLIYLAENSIEAGDMKKSEAYIDQLLDVYPVPLILSQLKNMQDDNLSLGPPSGPLKRMVATRLTERSKALMDAGIERN